eukprot:TCONS_00010142-protein
MFVYFIKIFSYALFCLYCRYLFTKRYYIYISFERNCVTMEDSLYMRFLYMEMKMSVAKIMLKFPTYSRATVFHHVKRPLKHAFDRRKLNRGRPRKLSERDERILIRNINRLRNSIGPFTLRRLSLESGIDEGISMATIS